MSLLLRGQIWFDSVGIYKMLPFSAFGIFLLSLPHEKRERKHFLIRILVSHWHFRVFGLNGLFLEFGYQYSVVTVGTAIC